MATSMKGVLILDKRKKKLIAKEIIYFFKSIFLLLLIWVGIEIRNIYLLKKNEAYKKEILTVSLELDSLQKIISNSSKKISFDELIGNYSDSITNSNSLRKVSTKKDVAENTLPLPPDEPDVPGTIALQKKPTQSVSSTSTFVPPSDGEALKEEDGLILVDGFSTLNEKARVWQCDELFNYLKSKNFNFKVGTQKTDIFKTYSSREIKVSQNLLDFDDGPKTDCEIFEMVIIDELNKEEKHFIENIFSFVRMNNKNLKLNTASFIRFLKGLPLEPPAESLNKKSILERQRDDFKLSISDNIIALIPSKKTRTVLFFWSLLFFGFLYLIRPIFYLLKWSYKTLNE